MKMHILVILLSTLVVLARAEHIQRSKVFIIPIEPKTFNWTVNGSNDKFLYQPSLLDAPDLPSWIHYTHSKRDYRGFLYGIVPKGLQNFQVRIVGLNKHTYETKYKDLEMNVDGKEILTKYEVQLKIDNLNVEDMFDHDRIQKLQELLREKWNATDLYMTFVASAVDLGARLPLKPEEGDGVVLRLGSAVPFSPELHKLQKEVKPLTKRPSCPRNYKRTTVEKSFREAGFALDWCSFRLIEENHSSHQESARRGPNMNVIGSPSSEISDHSEWRWARPTKAGIPSRSYFKEITTTVFVPTFVLLILAALLTAALCLQHDNAIDPESDQYFHELFNICTARKEITSRKREPTPVEGLGNNEVRMVQYATSQRGTLRSLSAQPSSPSGSLTRSPRASAERCNPYIRPNPPPYMGMNNPSGVRADF